MEETDTIGIGEYADYGGGDVVVKKISDYFKQSSQRGGERSDAKPWRSLRETKKPSSGQKVQVCDATKLGRVDVAGNPALLLKIIKAAAGRHK